MAQKRFPRRGDIKMHFTEYILFISGMRVEENNSTREERCIVVGQNGPYKASEIIMADGNKVHTCLSNSPVISLNTVPPTLWLLEVCSNFLFCICNRLKNNLYIFFVSKSKFPHLGDIFHVFIFCKPQRNLHFHL